MENSNGSSNPSNFAHLRSLARLPNKDPFQCTLPFHADYISSFAVGSEDFVKNIEEQVLVEEQPSWLEELLNEPETPVRRGHRRSTSDSFAYIDSAAKAFRNEDYKFKNITARLSCVYQNFDHFKKSWQDSFYAKPDLTYVTCSGGLPSVGDSITLPTSLSPFTLKESAGSVPSNTIVKQDREDLEGSSGKNSSASKADSKRDKQQFAQRSRVRKLQYISQLERNVQALQAEGSEVSAELEFLDHQNLILGMENRTLRQRLESLSQSLHIKCLEREMLEREIERLQMLYQQQQRLQLQQQKHSTRRRSKSTDFDSHFANLSI